VTEGESRKETTMTQAETSMARSEVRPFRTDIDGLDIHFIHVRSPHEHALPLIITHG
jgi:Epoxide hydrolase N terminus